MALYRVALFIWANHLNFTENRLSGWKNFLSLIFMALADYRVIRHLYAAIKC